VKTHHSRSKSVAYNLNTHYTASILRGPCDGNMWSDIIMIHSNYWGDIGHWVANVTGESAGCSAETSLLHVTADEVDAP